MLSLSFLWCACLVSQEGVLLPDFQKERGRSTNQYMPVYIVHTFGSCNCWSSGTGGSPTSKRWNLCLTDGRFLTRRNDLKAVNMALSSLDDNLRRCSLRGWWRASTLSSSKSGHKSKLSCSNVNRSLRVQ